MTCTKCGKDEQLRRGLCKCCWASNRNRIGWESRYVDARPVRAHVNMLIAAALGTRQISRLSRVNRKQIQWIISGRSERHTGPSTRVLRTTAERILAVPIPVERHHLAAAHTPVLAVGSMRRIQALVAIGYTQTYIAGRLGITVSNMGYLIHGKRPCVTAGRARQIELLYLELSDHPPEPGHSATKSRNYAERRGWIDPFGWEHEDIDNPDAVGWGIDTASPGR